MSSDPISPQHYKHLPAEAINIIEAAIAKAPSNQSAYLHGQVLKYLLRCWEKEGIEDLSKAKWYLDRMVASFDEVPAEASGASETPIDEPGQDDHFHDFKIGDEVISWQGQEGVIEAINLIEDFPITVRHSMREQASYKLGGVKKKHDDHPGDETPSEDRPPEGWRKMSIGEDIQPSVKFWFRGNWMSYEEDNLPTGELTGLHVTHIRKIETPGDPFRRYRDPTKDDLANGAINCECRATQLDDWTPQVLIDVLSGTVYRFRAQCPDNQHKITRWAQCRIEVAE